LDGATKKKTAFVFVVVCILTAYAAPTLIIPVATVSPIPTNTLEQPESSTPIVPALEQDGRPVYQMSFITHTPIGDIPGRKWTWRIPILVAGLADYAWTIKELLATIPLKR
jgi:branched-subunit amino acid transport protein